MEGCLCQVDAAFKAAIETDAVRQRIQERLVQERARMESEVEAKIAEERRIQLLRKRKEQEQRLRDQVLPKTSTSIEPTQTHMTCTMNPRPPARSSFPALARILLSCLSMVEA